MRYQLPWPAIKVCAVGLLHADGGIPWRSHNLFILGSKVAYENFINTSILITEYQWCSLGLKTCFERLGLVSVSLVQEEVWRGFCAFTVEPFFTVLNVTSKPTRCSIPFIILLYNNPFLLALVWYGMPSNIGVARIYDWGAGTSIANANAT